MILRTRLSRAVAVAALGAALATGVTGCSGAQQPAGQSATTLELDPAAFAERAAEDGVVLLDVRTPAEFAEGHLPDAINIDIDSGSFTEQVGELDKDAPYALYCRTDNRSGVAMGIMADLGFTDLAHLDGGIVDWAAAGGAIVQ